MLAIFEWEPFSSLVLLMYWVIASPLSSLSNNGNVSWWWTQLMDQYNMFCVAIPSGGRMSW